MTEEARKGIISTNTPLNQEVRGVNILDLNVCGNMASKQRACTVSKVDNLGVYHYCHTWNKCSVLCSHHCVLHAGDRDTWLGVKPGFYCCRRPEQVALEPHCVQVGFSPPCLLWAVSSLKVVSSEVAGVAITWERLSNTPPFEITTLLAKVNRTGWFPSGKLFP